MGFWDFPFFCTARDRKKRYAGEVRGRHYVCWIALAWFLWKTFFWKNTFSKNIFSVIENWKFSKKSQWSHATWGQWHRGFRVGLGVFLTWLFCTSFCELFVHTPRVSTVVLTLENWLVGLFPVCYQSDYDIKFPNRFCSSISPSAASKFSQLAGFRLSRVCTPNTKGLQVISNGVLMDFGIFRFSAQRATGEKRYVGGVRTYY